MTLEYTPPSGTKVRDAAGNDAAAFPRAGTPAIPALDVTVTPDTRAPLVSGATVDGTALKVTFDEALDTNSIPAAPGGFTVTVTRDGSPVSGVAVSALALDGGGTVLTLTLSQAVRGGDAVTLAYAEPSTPLRDRATVPNKVANFTTGSGGVPPVDNRTPSVRTVAFAGTAQALAIDGKVAVDVTFTEAVRVTGRPTLAVRFSGNTPDTRQARYVSGTGTDRLRFEYTVVEGDEDTDGIEIEAGEIALLRAVPS